MGATPPPSPVFLGLGTNLGDRQANLDQALALLRARLGPLTLSSTYETPPWGDLDQPAFLNAVCHGRTTLAPEAVLDACQDVERVMGRVRTRRWGPRVIDVDVLALGPLALDTARLQLPHPRLHERGFVLLPLAEVAPGWRHPILGRTAAELRDALPASETAGIHKLPGR